MGKRHYLFPPVRRARNMRRFWLLRRTLFLTLGLLEFGVAALLAILGTQLPSSAEVDQSFDNAERVTRRAGSQVQLSRQQIHDLRGPELRELAERLDKQ